MPLSSPVTAMGLPAVLTAVLTVPTLPTPAAAVSPRANSAVAARIAAELGCRDFSYASGTNSVSSSWGRLDCSVRDHEFVVYVFGSNRSRARGEAHMRLWSGNDAPYFFARRHRALIAPAGGGFKPPYSRRWARVAAQRTEGVVFSE